MALIYENKFAMVYGEHLPQDEVEDVLEELRESLIGSLVGAIKPDTKYLVELKQGYYEQPHLDRAGYKAAIRIEEYKGEG